MNSRIRFRTGITLGIVAAATLVGCGDDDSAPVLTTDAGADGGLVTSPSPTSDESTSDIEDTTGSVAVTSDEPGPTSGPGADEDAGVTGSSADTTSAVVDTSAPVDVPDASSTEGEPSTGSTSDDTVIATTGDGDSTGPATDTVVTSDGEPATTEGPATSAPVTENTGGETSAVVDTTGPLDTSAVVDTTGPVDTSAVDTSATSDTVVAIDTTDGVDTSGVVVITGELSTSEAVSSTEGVVVTSDGEGTETTEEPPAADWVGLEVGQGAVTPVALEALGNDSYLGVVYDADGNFYAVGTATDTSGGSPDVYMVVTKFLGNGVIDTTFGDNGTARKNVAVGGTEAVRAIAIQTTGLPATSYIVIAGTAQFEPTATGLIAAEQDVAVARFTMEGDLDTSFGASGVVRLNLNSGIEGVDRNNNPAWVGNEAVWSLGTTMGDRLVIHGEQRTELVTNLEGGGTAPRTDVDWALVRLLADGTPDPSFGGGDGKVTLDLAGAGASARAATVLEDGSIIGTGYLSSEVLGQSTQQPVLYKVTAAGEFDVNFATQDIWAADGVFHDLVVAPPLRAEAYGAAVQGTHLVTMGYGPTTGAGTGTDFIALRFTADGNFDTTFGDNGHVYVDAAGQSDNGRAVIVLPDQTILGIGGGRRLPEGSTTAVSDGMLVLLSPDGDPIQSFGEGGLRLYDFGGSSDFLWAGAVSPDHTSVAIVGIKGATGTGDDADTDGVAVVLPLTPVVN